MSLAIERARAVLETSIDALTSFCREQANRQINMMRFASSWNELPGLRSKSRAIGSTNAG